MFLPIANRTHHTRRFLHAITVSKNRLRDSSWDIDEGWQVSIENVIGMLQFRRVPLSTVTRKLFFIILKENWKTFAIYLIDGATQPKWADSEGLEIRFQTVFRTPGLDKQRRFHSSVSVSLAQNPQSFWRLLTEGKLNIPRTAEPRLLKVDCWIYHKLAQHLIISASSPKGLWRKY